MVSLVPSVTETLLAWGVRPIACTRFCEQPNIPAVGGTKDPKVAAVAQLAPDLVVVDEEENRREDYEALLAAGLDVLALAVRDLSSLADGLEALAVRVGLPPGTGTRVVESARVRAPETGTRGPTTSRDVVRSELRVVVPIWRRPWRFLGAPTYGTALLERLGARNLVAETLGARGAYPEASVEDVASLEPDLVLAPSEPYPFSERHRGELEAMGPVLFVDGHDLFWWGARTPAALERLGVLLGGEDKPSRRGPTPDDARERSAGGSGD